MAEALLVTLFPVVFLAVLFIGGELSRRRHVDIDGVAPINRTLFYSSKYLIVLVWLAMILASWGVGFSLFAVPLSLRWSAVFLWVFGFVIMFAGRVELGASFRIGRPKEHTHLKVGGLFRISRNPMYLGVYATLLASVLRTLNPVVLALVVFIVVVHHRIVLAEEEHMCEVFGKEYSLYCQRVRRYL